MVSLRNKFQQAVDKTLDGYQSTVAKKGRVSFSDADEIIDITDDKTIAKVPDFYKIPSSSQNIMDLLLPTNQVASNAPAAGGIRHYRLSSRIENLAKPLARWRKPLIRLTSVFREVDQQIPWSKKGPNVTNKKTEIVILEPLPLPPRTITGVSRAALKYQASEHIKRLAKHRPKPKAEDKNKCFSVKPSSLLYKPSVRIQQLSKPRIRKMKK